MMDEYRSRDVSRKFLVVVDSTPECMNALRFAARRAANTGGGVAMLYVIPPEEAHVFMMVGDRMRRDAWDEAGQRLQSLAMNVQERVGVLPEFYIREGEPEAEILRLIEEDHDIRVMVLGASVGRDGPGPLVTSLVGKQSGRMPVPVTVVPGGMSLEDIDTIC